MGPVFAQNEACVTLAAETGFPLTLGKWGKIAEHIVFSCMQAPTSRVSDRLTRSSSSSQSSDSPALLIPSERSLRDVHTSSSSLTSPPTAKP